MTRITFYIFFSVLITLTFCVASNADTSAGTSKTRIVSLTPHITDILFDIGAGDNVVGTPFTYDNEHPGISVIGNFMNPSLEKVVSLNPTLIIGSSASARPEFIAKLKQLGYRVELVNEGYLVDIYRSIMTIGVLTEKEDTSKKLISSMQAEIGRLEYSIIHKPRKTVFYQIWDRPLMSIGNETYLRELLMKAHLQPVAINSEGYSRISIEEVIQADPDVILIPYDSTMNVDANIFVRAWDKYPQMKAVKNHQVLLINSDNLHRPGTKLTKGLQELIEVVWGIK